MLNYSYQVQQLSAHASAKSLSCLKINDRAIAKQREETKLKIS